MTDDKPEGPTPPNWFYILGRDRVINERALAELDARLDEAVRDAEEHWREDMIGDYLLLADFRDLWEDWRG